MTAEEHDDKHLTKRTKRTEELRRRILDESMKLFFEQGFEGTTTRQILDRVGILNGSLYNIYRSKEEIFSDITEDSYQYEAGDATKVVGAAYTNLQDWGYCGSGQAPMLCQEICTDAAVFPANGSGWDDGGVFRRMHQHSWNSEQLQVNRLWEVCYSGIILANRAISIISQEGFPFHNHARRPCHRE